jgi:hypothetical protein
MANVADLVILPGLLFLRGGMISWHTKKDKVPAETDVIRMPSIAA